MGEEERLEVEQVSRVHQSRATHILYYVQLCSICLGHVTTLDQSVMLHALVAWWPSDQVAATVLIQMCRVRVSTISCSTIYATQFHRTGHC